MWTTTSKRLCAPVQVFRYNLLLTGKKGRPQQVALVIHVSKWNGDQFVLLEPESALLVLASGLALVPDPASPVSL